MDGFWLPSVSQFDTHRGIVMRSGAARTTKASPLEWKPGFIKAGSSDIFHSFSAKMHKSRVSLVSHSPSDSNRKTLKPRQTSAG